MAKIEKKVQPPYFQDILDGKKNFELRLGQFECKEGDVLVLREWDPIKNDYTGRVVEKEVTYILKTKDCEKFWTKVDIEKYGYKIVGFK